MKEGQKKLYQMGEKKKKKNLVADLTLSSLFFRKKVVLEHCFEIV